MSVADKPYIVFAWSEYYPSGGWRDFVGEADTMASAMTMAEVAARECGTEPMSYGQVIERSTGKVSIFNARSETWEPE